MKMVIDYEDGTKQVAKVKPRHLVRFEDEVGEFTEGIANTYRLAWMASDSPEDFRAWLDRVEDITVDQPAESGTADPNGGGDPVPTE